VRVVERVSASQKLARKDAEALLAQVTHVIAAKGSKVERFNTGGKASAQVIGAMLGPTGNLRAPTLRVGRTLLVGFHEETFREVFG
jgi:hypothetical protein